MFTHGQRLNLGAFLTLAVMFALFLCHSWYGPDIWYHLTWGRSLLENGSLLPQTQTLIAQPIPTNSYWLFQILTATLFQHAGGIYAVSVLFFLLWFTIAVLWIELAHAWSRPLLVLAAVLLFQVRFEQRPEIFAYLFLLLTMRLLMARAPSTRASWRLVLALFVNEALWASMHGYFALGPLVAGAYMLSTVRGSQEDRRAGVSLFAATVLGSLATPFGWTVWQGVWAYMQVSASLRDLNLELFAPTFWPPSWPLSLLAVWIALTLVLALRTLWRREAIFEALIALGGVVLSLEAARNVPMVVLLSAPLWRTCPRFSPRIQPLAAAIAIALALGLSVSAVSGSYLRTIGSLGSFGVHLEWTSYPIGAAQALGESYNGRLFCDSYDGGYLEYQLPQAKIAGDSYFADPELTHRYFAAIRDPSALVQLDAELHFDSFLINVENLAEVDWALNTPALTLIYNDSHRALFRRRETGSPAADPARASYWHGETLKNINNAFGPISWAAIARKHHWSAVLNKILQDIEDSPVIPSGILRQSLAYAVDTQDRELAVRALALMGKVEMDEGDAAALADLSAKADACCH